ncbi:hypothetical protein NDU88_007983 [Pleurodeles waltl]|uniref:Uncharacterized protein n=1 Tax=Pleurodeles waltl TaxID=8319 RepID=A0AAV7VRY9_PLEWA|nr:hypothetical protein NDU88_007983 [Pleurodeles waltl]
MSGADTPRYLALPGGAEIDGADLLCWRTVRSWGRLHCPRVLAAGVTTPRCLTAPGGTGINGADPQHQGDRTELEPLA